MVTEIQHRSFAQSTTERFKILNYQSKTSARNAPKKISPDMEEMSRDENLVGAGDEGDIKNTTTVAAALRKEYLLGCNYQSSVR